MTSCKGTQQLEVPLLKTWSCIAIKCPTGAAIWSTNWVLTCMQGDLALLASKGSRGIPIGHTVAHNANHALQLRFLQALKAAVSNEDYVDVDAPCLAWGIMKFIDTA